MKSIFLIVLSFYFSVLCADTATVYNLGKGNTQTLVASYEYSPPIKKPIDLFDIMKSKEVIYLQRDNLEEVVFFNKDKKSTFLRKGKECCDYILSDNSDDVYAVEKKGNEQNIVIYDVKDGKVKQKIKVPYGDNLTVSLDGWVYLQNHEYTPNTKVGRTTIYRKKISNFNSAWEKVLEENKLFYIYCVPTDNSFSIMTQDTENPVFQKFYNVDKNQRLTYLGKMNPNVVPLGKYAVYNNQAQPIFFKDQKIYTFQETELKVDKDFSGSQFKTITVEQNNIYGIVF